MVDPNTPPIEKILFAIIHVTFFFYNVGQLTTLFSIFFYEYGPILRASFFLFFFIVFFVLFFHIHTYI